MPDYKELYFNMFRASEQAVNVLITAQRECEELYISSSEPDCKVIPLSAETDKGADKE